MNKDRWDEVAGDEFFEFERIPTEDRRSEDRQLCAFIYLTEIFPNSHPVEGADHDVIFLGGDQEKLTDEQAIYLSRCGVSYSSDYVCLTMNV